MWFRWWLFSTEIWTSALKRISNAKMKPVLPLLKSGYTACSALSFSLENGVVFYCSLIHTPRIPWLAQIYFGMYRFIVACSHILWPVLICCGLYRYTVACTYILVYCHLYCTDILFLFLFLSSIGMQCSVLIYSGLQWYTVAWTSIPYYLYWHTGVYASILWSVLCTVHCTGGYCGLCWYAFPLLAYCFFWSVIRRPLLNLVYNFVVCTSKMWPGSISIDFCFC